MTVDKTKKVSFRDRVDSFFRSVEKSAASLVAASGVFAKVEKVASQTLKALIEIKQHKRDIAKLMTKVAYTNECVSENLCNMILAMNQHAFLKAWYPEHGKKPEKCTPTSIEEMLEIHDWFAENAHEPDDDYEL